MAECTKDDTCRLQRLILATCRPDRAGDMRFTTRIVNEDGKYGVRCWRTK